VNLIMHYSLNLRAQILFDVTTITTTTTDNEQLTSQLTEESGKIQSSLHDT
jgi:hypothetical protein